MMKKEKIIKTSFIILFSFFLLIATTFYFINENSVLSQQINKYKDPDSANQEDAAFHKVEIKGQAANFSNLDTDIFGIKKSILL